MKSTLSNFRFGAPSHAVAPDTNASGPHHPPNPVDGGRYASAHVNELRHLASPRQVAGEASRTTGLAARIKTMFRTSADPAVGPKINKLPSGRKIGSSTEPHNTVDKLEPSEIGALAVALNLAKLGEASNTRYNAIAVKQRLASIAKDLDEGLIDYDNAFLDHAHTTSKLTGAEVDELKSLMGLTHMAVRSRSFPSPNGSRSMLKLYFAGTQNMRDVRQDLNSALGMAGEIIRASHRIGQLMSKMLVPNGNASLESVIGLSMGGGSAQVFMASVESRVELESRPAVVLLDPVLLNNRQAELAVKGGTRPVDFEQPRGIAVTLDYAKNSQRGLMSKMKTLGYHSPGLVRLKLGLDDHDGQPRGSEKPKPVPIGLGYHGRNAYYAEALKRFSADHDAHRSSSVTTSLNSPLNRSTVIASRPQTSAFAQRMAGSSVLTSASVPAASQRIGKFSAPSNMAANVRVTASGKPAEDRKKALSFQEQFGYLAPLIE